MERLKQLDKCMRTMATAINKVREDTKQHTSDVIKDLQSQYVDLRCERRNLTLKK